MEAICQAENLNLGRSGIDAVFKLGAGDMRRVVNMLQVISLLFSLYRWQILLTPSKLNIFTRLQAILVLNYCRSS